MRTRKRISAFLLALMLALLLAAAALADGEPEHPEDAADPIPAAETVPEAAAEAPEAVIEPVTEPEAPAPERHTETGTVPGGAADNAALLDGYAARALGLAPEGPAGDAAPLEAWRRLDGASAAVYPLLREQAALVAAGERVETEFTFSYEEVFGRTYWTAAELGVIRLTRNGRLTPEAQDAADERLACDVTRLIDALLSDCPYELYWFDKTREYEIAWDDPIPDGDRLLLTGAYTIRMCVAPEYAAGGDYRMDPSLGRAACAAAQNARRIAAEQAGASDLDRLYAYRDEICSLNVYNDAAAEDPSVPYGNPWQLIWVFDGDPATNVVCEGYSKAFQYLCDLTDFREDIRCCSVWGEADFGDGAGPHMWNVLRMPDGRNYLADVTASDMDDYGVSEDLFLRGCDYGSLFGGYCFTDELGGASYYTYDYYDDSVLTVFLPEDLTLSCADYGADDPLASGVALDAAHFPDAALRAWLLSVYDWEEDGYLSPLEVEDVSWIDTSGIAVSDLRGIEYLPRLRHLFCANLGLTALDVTRNGMLRTLYCPNNALTALDLRGCPALTYLDCSSNRLSALDLTGKALLDTLYCEHNLLTELDLRYCDTLLAELDYDLPKAADGVVEYCWTDPGSGETLVDLSCDDTLLLKLERPALDAAQILQFCVGLRPDWEDIEYTPMDAAMLLSGRDRY